LPQAHRRKDGYCRCLSAQPQSRGVTAYSVVLPPLLSAIERLDGHAGSACSYPVVAPPDRTQESPTAHHLPASRILASEGGGAPQAVASKWCCRSAVPMPPRSTPPVRGGSSGTRQGARCSNGCFAANRVRGSRPFFVAPSPGGDWSLGRSWTQGGGLSTPDPECCVRASLVPGWVSGLGVISWWIVVARWGPASAARARGGEDRGARLRVFDTSPPGKSRGCD